MNTRSALKHVRTILGNQIFKQNGSPINLNVTHGNQPIGLYTADHLYVFSNIIFVEAYFNTILAGKVF